MRPSSRSQSAATTALRKVHGELFRVKRLREIPLWCILGRCGPPNVTAVPPRSVARWVASLDFLNFTMARSAHRTVLQICDRLTQDRQVRGSAPRYWNRRSVAVQGQYRDPRGGGLSAQEPSAVRRPSTSFRPLRQSRRPRRSEQPARRPAPATLETSRAAGWRWSRRGSRVRGQRRAPSACGRRTARV